MSEPGLRIAHARTLTFARAILSQGLSATTNFLLAIAVARNSTIAEFGKFALAYSAYLIYVALLRATVLDPLLIVGPSLSESAFSRVAASAHRAVTGLSCAALALTPLLVILAVASGFDWLWITAAVLGCAGLGRVEAVRYTYFAQGKPGRSVGVDAIWLLLFVIFWLANVPLLGRHGLVLYIGWVLCGIAGGFIANRRLDRPSFIWLREQAHLSGRYAWEAVIAMSGAQALMWAFAAMGGLPAAGAFRALQTLFGPLNTLVSSMQVIAVPEGVRHFRATVVLYSVRVGAIAVAAAISWSAALNAMPQHWMTHVLGDVGDEAARFLLSYSTYVILGTVALGPVVGLRVLAAAQATLKARCVTVAMTLCVGAVVLALSGELTATLFALATAQLAGAGVWWWHLRIATRQSQW